MPEYLSDDFHFKIFVLSENLILHNPQHVGFETDCRRLKAGVERVLKAGKVKRKYVCMLL